MKKMLFVSVLSIVLLRCGAVSAAEVNTPADRRIAPKNIVIPVELQAWQKRRSEFITIVHGVEKRDPEAIKAFDKTLTEFETCKMCRTPMENMEIVGVFYVPKDGFDKCLPIVVMNAMLGWYDALRFGSESGRAEIVNNEGFFKKALILGGKEKGQTAVKFLTENPERAAELVEKGLKFAEQFKDNPRYDPHWPTGYGLERVICATGGSCTPIAEMPEDQWGKAWDDAKQKVLAYYNLRHIK